MGVEGTRSPLATIRSYAEGGTVQYKQCLKTKPVLEDVFRVFFNPVR